MCWIGAFAVVLAAVPYKSFELDRHFVPKELALHITALVTALIVIAKCTRWSLTRADLLLVTFLALSALSAVFATNHWLALRALGISLSGITLFWTTSMLAHGGRRRTILIGLVLAMFAGVATALAQAYGIVGEYASLSRAPGGTFGNRNFMAHLAVICLPATFYLASRAGARGFAWACAGLTALAGALVLSRSRAAWVALFVTTLVMLPFLWRLSVTPDGRRGPFVKRAFTLLAALGLGAALSITLPNALEWKSDSPYLDSVRGVVNYKEGSGKGRLIQYRRSLGLALRHPLFGVGTGNWSVAYPSVAPDSDPSLASDGRTANPWPSSDWMAILSERGLPAFLTMVLAVIALFVAAWRRFRHARRDEGAAAVAMGATVLATAIVGTFDAVLSIAIPSFFMWAIVGALSGRGDGEEPLGRIRRTFTVGGVRRVGAMAAAIVLGGGLVTYSFAEARAMAWYEDGTTAAMRRAAQLDPGSYRIRMRLAAAYARNGQCTRAIPHARAARALFPYASEPVSVLRRCRASSVGSSSSSR